MTCYHSISDGHVCSGKDCHHASHAVGCATVPLEPGPVTFVPVPAHVHASPEHAIPSATVPAHVHAEHVHLDTFRAMVAERDASRARVESLYSELMRAEKERDEAVDGECARACERDRLREEVESLSGVLTAQGDAWVEFERTPPGKLHASAVAVVAKWRKAAAELGWLAPADARRLRTENEGLRGALSPLGRWPTVYEFALVMVMKLDANRAKKGGREGWQDDEPGGLLRRVREETDELARELARVPQSAGAALAEAADVANMAMMVADACGALKGGPIAALSSPSTDTPKRSPICEKCGGKAEDDGFTAPEILCRCAAPEHHIGMRAGHPWCETHDRPLENGDCPGPRKSVPEATDDRQGPLAANEDMRTQFLASLSPSARGYVESLERVVGAIRSLDPGPEPLAKAKDNERERLGRVVREVWIGWAKEQPNPKLSWLVPWDGLSESDREVDRRIGERLAAMVREACAEVAYRWCCGDTDYGQDIAKAIRSLDLEPLLRGGGR